jgi:anaerobic selenocysteine-containing dehydrogenase
MEMTHTEEDRKKGFRLGRMAFLGLSAAVGVGAALGVGLSVQSGGLINRAMASEPLDEKWVATSCLNCPT